MQNPFANDNTHPQEKTNIAPLLTGDKLITLLAKLAEKGLMEWDAERSLAMVAKRVLTQTAGSTEEAQGLRGWLSSQGFRGSRRSRSFYLSLSDLESRGVTITDGKPQVCEPKVQQAKGRSKATLNFSDIMGLTE